MAGMGDTSGDIQPVSEHVKDILQITRDSEMIQSYVRVGKADDGSDDDAGSTGGPGGCVSGGGGGGGGGNGLGGDGGGGLDSDGGVQGVDGPGDERRGRKGKAAAGRRRRGRRTIDGGGGGTGGSSTIKFDELTEEFKTRKSGTGGGGGGFGFGSGWARRHKRDSRSRLLEEVYTDKDRAAAVNLGTRDIKASLRMKRRQDRNRTLHIPSTAESPTLLALARHCISDVTVALEFIDKALELSPNDKTALVSRSKCYLLLGQPRLALKDAELALNEDSTYLKAMYQKAEALYHLGDFEHSLVFYHRGLHVRPELEQFRLGVQKAREAIENAIGKMRDTAQQQVARGDVRRQTTVVAQQQQRPVDEGNAFKRQATSDSAAGRVNGGRTVARAATGSSSRRKDSAPPVADTATAVAGNITTKCQSKMLLRELCVDKDYLEHLTVDPNIVSVIQENDDYILSEAKDGINFLNGREEFWKQQKLIM